MDAAKWRGFLYRSELVAFLEAYDQQAEAFQPLGLQQEPDRSCLCVAETVSSPMSRKPSRDRR